MLHTYFRQYTEKITDFLKISVISHAKADRLSFKNKSEMISHTIKKGCYFRKVKRIRYP